MSPKIIILGKEYTSLEEVPVELRELYQEMSQVLGDKNGDGLPDIFEGKLGKLNPEKIEQLREIAQRIKGKPTASETNRPQTTPNPPQHAPLPLVTPSESSSSLLFTLGVLIIGIFLLVGVIYLYRSGYFH